MKKVIASLSLIMISIVMFAQADYSLFHNFSFLILLDIAWMVLG